MIWYEDLYVGYNLLDKKRKVIRKTNTNTSLRR